MADKKIYLGDDVYAEWDEKAEQIVLTTENDEPDDPRNVIYLERAVYEALTAYADAVFSGEDNP